MCRSKKGKIESMLKTLKKAGILELIGHSPEKQCTISRAKLKKTGESSQRAYNMLEQIAREGSKSLGNGSIRYDGKTAILKPSARTSIFNVSKSFGYLG
ncbi:MAG: hypothetical protein GTN36_03320 [Candidatus Aenigmarchaeota archaeon]|nr:hypothetical protein [Candidatus Aenigmarchaeota archaeon]